jgi:deoxyribonuclease-4
MLIGCHISIRRGYLEAAKAAKAMEARSFQYFPKNPRSLSVKTFDRRDAAACAEYCGKYGLVSIAHTPYPTNLAVAPSELRQATVRSLINDLDICDACGSVGLVVHFGRWKGEDALQGYRYIIETLNEVLSRWEGRALVLLENQAGEGAVFGTTLEELVHIRRLTVNPGKIGFCFDTCHAFASGLWRGDNWEEVERAGERMDYFRHVRAVHLNDSRYPAGSGKDRHENIGRGLIGETNLRNFISRPWLEHVPVILETPATSPDTRLRELAWLRGRAVERNAGRNSGHS